MTLRTIEFLLADQSHANVLSALHAHGFSPPWPAKAFVDLLNQDNVFAWIAMAPTPVGFVMIRKAADEAEILTLAVAEYRRREGHGRRLVDKAWTEVQCLGAETFHLEVAADNDSALGLYRSCGFTEVGRRAGYYARTGGPIDAILMSLQ